MESLNSMSKKRIIAIGVVILILFCDQIIKFWVKTNMALHEAIVMAENWAQLLFTENKGMAFGWDFMGTYFLCGLRIVAVCYLGYFINNAIKMKKSLGFVVCLSMVLAGAAGNIFDNIFYGLIFTESTPWQIASLVPFGEGYGDAFAGRVVDMFYFPMIDVILPDWVPFNGGERFIFFSPIFNFADASISVGGAMIVLFYPRTFSAMFNDGGRKKKVQDNEGNSEEKGLEK